MGTYKRWLLDSRPSGMPEHANFRMVEAAIPSPSDGELLLETRYLSVDPYMRGRMRDAASYAAPVQLGEVMTGGGVGIVTASRHQRYKVGDYLEGVTGWQTHIVTDGKGFRQVDPKVAPIATALGILGMPGLTAYFGLLDLGLPKPGETVLVSGAAGAVGSVVGQIAKLKGCRAVGIAGADDKVARITRDLGFDAAFNYKTNPDYKAKIRELCPSGVDIYFDNVGGPITDAVFSQINESARILICGQISQYNSEQGEQGPRNLFRLIIKRARIEGFLVMDYAQRFPEARGTMARWLHEGKLRYQETIVEGFEKMPEAFIAMMNGANTGKMLVKV